MIKNGKQDKDMREVPEITDVFVPTAVLVIEANGKRCYASLEDNSAEKAFVEKLRGEVTFDMRDGGFCKIGHFTCRLPQNDEEMTVKPGDIVLCGEDKLMICYDESRGIFTKIASQSYVSKEKLLDILGEGDVSVKLFLEWSE
ncbi:MAG: hypothetical protein IJR55_02640 [Clostridia bacterium]|nr:hypothetical protein [Clostridia bacterium]